jgi:hypothetical protein
MHLARIAILALLLLSQPDDVSAETGGMVPPAGGLVAPLPTDDAVRRGMLAIRDLVRLNHSLVTHRRMPPDHAARFARQVKVEADTILSTSKLAGEGRDKLRGVLDEIVAGIAAVAGRDGAVSPLDGLVRADEALARYAREFDHPGWAPLQSLD